MPVFCETKWKLRSRREFNACYCSIHPRVLSLVPRLQRWTFQPMGGRTLQAWEPWPSQSSSGRRSARGRPPTLWCLWLPRTPGTLGWRALKVTVNSPKQLRISPNGVKPLSHKLLRPCVIYCFSAEQIISTWTSPWKPWTSLSDCRPSDWYSAAVSPPGL